MDKRTFGVGALTLTLVTMGTLLGGGAAYADAGPYTPDEPKEPSLAGSRVAATCIDDVPWIQYEVTLNDPDHVVTTNTARLVISDSTHRISIALGTLQNGRLSGSVLWPGADTDGDGDADSWPGWEHESRSWVETDGNYRWTRGQIEAHIEVNPDMAVPLAYPADTAACAGPEGSIAAIRTVDDPVGLARTGGTTGTLIAAGGIGGVLLIIGAVLTRRRKTRA